MKLSGISRLTRQQRTLLIIAAVVLLGVVVGGPVFAKSILGSIAQGTTNVLGNAIFLFLSFIVWAMTKFFALLTAIFISLLVIVARYNVFLNAPVVQSGWPIVRDLMNMVFIIALLIIAAGTVLRLQNYRYNRLLGKLIIMAVLVNFSKFIAVFLLQFAQIVMLTFVNAFRDVAFANFSHSFGLDQVLAFAAKGNWTKDNGAFSVLLSLLAGLIMMIVSFVVMLSMTVMLFVRIIALWLLIILSPVAFALRVLPNTERYAAQWWSEFTKYAVLGPVLAFFLWLSLALANSGSCDTKASTGCENPLRADSQVSDSITKTDAANQELTGDLMTSVLGIDKMMSFVVAIIFLMLGLQYAQKSGAAGASFAGKVAQTGFGMAGAVTGLNAIRDRTIAPVQGWFRNRASARQAAIQERTMGLEAAGDRAKARFGFTPAARERGAAAAASYERQKVARQAQKQGYANLSREDLLGHMRSKTDMSKRMAATQELASRGMLDLNDATQRTDFDYITSRSRMPQADVRKLREQALDANVRSTSEQQLREDSQLSTNENPEAAKRENEANKDRRIRAIQELDRRQRLNKDDVEFGARNVELTRQLGTDLVGSPEKIRAYRESMMRNNPEMAKHVLFNDLKSDRDVEDMMEAVQQKQLSTSALTKGFYQDLMKQAHLGVDGREVTGEAERQAIGQAKAARIMNRLKDISPDGETLRGYVKNMDPEALRLFGQHLQMNDTDSLDRRAMVARETGEWGRAFHKTKNYTAGQMVKQTKEDGSEEEVWVSDAQEYIDKLGGAEITRNISDTALEDEHILQTLQKSSNFRFKDWETLRLRRKESRTALETGWGKIIGALPKDKDREGHETNGVSFKLADYNGDSRQLQAAEFAAQQYFLSTKGEQNPYDLGSDEGLEHYRSAVSGASATELSGIEDSKDYRESMAGDGEYARLLREEMVINTDPGEMKDLLLMKKEFAIESLKDAQKRLENDIRTGGPVEAGRARNILRRLSNQVGTHKYISYNPKQFDEDYEEGAGSKSRRPTGPTGEGGPSDTGPDTGPTGGSAPTHPSPKPRPHKPSPMKMPKPKPPEPAPASTPEPEATEPKHPEKLRDALIDQRGMERLDRTREKMAEYEELGGPDAFYASSEYLKNRDQYLTADQVRKLEAHPLGGVSSFGRSNQASNTLGFDSRVAGFESFANAGEYITDPARKQAFAAQYVKQIDDQLARLEAKPLDERSRGEQTYIDRLARAKERLSNPDELANLQIVNNARLGYSDRHVVAHERTHDQLKSIDADGSFRKQLMSGMAPEALQETLNQVRAKMNNAEMSDAEAFDEYLTEGIVNAKESWADTSKDAIKLDPDIFTQVQKRAFDDAVQKGQTPEQAEKAKFAVTAPMTSGTAAQPKDSRENLMFKAMRVRDEKAAADFRAAEEARMAKEAEARAAQEAKEQAEREAQQAADQQTDDEHLNDLERRARQEVTRGSLRVGRRGQAGIGRRVIDAAGAAAAGVREVGDAIGRARMEGQMRKVAKDNEQLQGMKSSVAERRAYRDNAVARVADAKQELAAKAGDVVATGTHMRQEESLTDALRPYQARLRSEEERAETAIRDLQRAVDAGIKKQRTVQQGKANVGIKKPAKSVTPPSPSTTPPPTPPEPPTP